MFFFLKIIFFFWNPVVMNEKLIYSSKFEDIYFDSQMREALQIWNENTTLLNDSLLKEEQVKMAELFEEYKPLFHLADARKFFYPISPEIQHWINTEIAARIKIGGVRRSAMVLPEEFIAALGVEQLGEEIGDAQSSKKNKSDTYDYDVAVFSSLEEAREWFKNS